MIDYRKTRIAVLAAAGGLVLAGPLSGPAVAQDLNLELNHGIEVFRVGDFG